MLIPSRGAPQALEVEGKWPHLPVLPLFLFIHGTCEGPLDFETSGFFFHTLNVRGAIRFSSGKKVGPVAHPQERARNVDLHDYVVVVVVAPSSVANSQGY